MVEGLQWFLAFSSIGTTFLQGNKGGLGWALGMGNTALWIAYSVLTKQWGFIVLNLFLVAVQTRNYIKNR